MTKVVLKQDQYYVAVKGGNQFGKKGTIVDVDPTFLTLIVGKYEPSEGHQGGGSDDPVAEKPLSKMNKPEVVAKAGRMGINLTDEDVANNSRADIVKMIEEYKEKDPNPPNEGSQE